MNWQPVEDDMPEGNTLYLVWDGETFYIASYYAELWLADGGGEINPTHFCELEEPE